MKTDTPPPVVIASGKVSKLDGLRDFLETVVSSEEIKRSVICVESGSLSGEIGVFCSRYIIGARLRLTGDGAEELAKVIGFEAIRQIFSLRDGTISHVEASADDIALLRTSVAIDIFSLLDWSAQNSAGPPPMEVALDGVIESFAQTMLPMESGEVSHAPLHPHEGPHVGHTAVDEPRDDFSMYTRTEFDTALLDGIGNDALDVPLEPAATFALAPIDPVELDQIPTPKAWNPFGIPQDIADEDSSNGQTVAGSEFSAKRRESRMSEKDQKAVQQIYKDGQRTDRAREFIKVKKEKSVADPMKFEHKGAADYVTRLNVALVVLVCIGTIGSSLLLNHLMANAHDAQMAARGAERMARGESLGALLDFDSVVAHNSRSPKAFMDRASAYMALGDCDNAASDYRKAREIDPKDSRAYFGEASAILKRFDFTSAMRLLDDGLRLDPRSTEGLTLRAMVAASIGKYEQTISDATKAIGIDSNASPELYGWRAFAEWKSAKFKEALQDYDKAIGPTTSDAQLFLGRGSCYLALGQPDLALKDLHRAVTLDQRLAEAFTARGKAFTSQEDYKNALSDLTKAIELQRTSETFAARGRLHARFGQDGKAISDFDRALALSPDSKHIEALRVAAYSRVRRLKPIFAGDRPELDPPLPILAVAKAVQPASARQTANGTSANPDPLTAVLTDALRGSPNDTKSRRYLAYTFLRNGSYKDAVEQFKMLADAHSLGEQDQLSYADALARKGDIEQSIYIYKRVFDRNPYDRVARSNLIKLYMQQGRSFEAAALRSGVVTAGSSGARR